GGDGGQRECEPEALPGRQGLAEEQPPQDGGDRGGEQGEERHGGHRQPADAAEPDRVGEQGSRDGQPGVAADRAQVRFGRRPSKRASGRSTRPPAVSCQPARAVGPTPCGSPQRLVSTIPPAITAAAAIPARTPHRSKEIRPCRTISPTPAAPARPQPSRQRVGLSPSRRNASPTTISGWTAKRVAATPPGNR